MRNGLTLLCAVALLAGCGDGPEPSPRILSVERLEGATVPATSQWKDAQAVVYRVTLAVNPPEGANAPAVTAEMQRCPDAPRLFTPEVQVESWEDAGTTLGDGMVMGRIRVIGPHQYIDNDFYRCGSLSLDYDGEGKKAPVIVPLAFAGPPRDPYAPISD